VIEADCVDAEIYRGDRREALAPTELWFGITIRKLTVAVAGWRAGGAALVTRPPDPPQPALVMANTRTRIRAVGFI
jgi:hypothetical protein